MIENKNQKRINDQKKEERIDLIVEWLVNGLKRMEIVKKGEELWDVSFRQIDRYLASARILIKEKAAIEWELSLGRTIFRYEGLYRNAYESDDLKECRQILKDEIELLGLKNHKDANYKLELFLDSLDELKSDPNLEGENNAV